MPCAAPEQMTMLQHDQVKRPHPPMLQRLAPLSTAVVNPIAKLFPALLHMRLSQNIS